MNKTLHKDLNGDGLQSYIFWKYMIHSTFDISSIPDNDFSFLPSPFYFLYTMAICVFEEQN